MAEQERSAGARVVSAKVALAIGVVIAVLAGGVGAMAGGGGPFPDVSEDHPFATEIERLAGAGITAGYDDGTFRPGDPITRQAMAAFLNRGLGRVGHQPFDVQAAEPLDPSPTSFTDLAEVSVTAGADAGGGGFVILIAEANILLTAACDCTPVIELGPPVDGETPGRGAGFFPLGSDLDPSMTLVDVRPVAAGETLEATLRGTVGLGNPEAERPYWVGSLTALYVPFGPDGGNALDPTV